MVGNSENLRGLRGEILYALRVLHAHARGLRYLFTTGPLCANSPCGVGIAIKLSMSTRAELLMLLLYDQYYYYFDYYYDDYLLIHTSATAIENFETIINYRVLAAVV